MRRSPVHLALALSVLSAFTLLAPRQAPAQLTADTIRAVEALIEQEMAAQQIPGLSVAVGISRQLAWTRGFGFADLENRVPATADTVYRLASISKPVTAVAVLQLVEKGKLALEAPITELMPEFPPKPWPITVRQLLCHQGGIRHYARHEETSSARRYERLVDSLAIFAADPLVAEPGTRYVYTTYGYTLLGCAVERASGLPFERYLQEHVFTPAGMSGARVDDARRLIPHRAQGYRKHDGEIVNSPPVDTSNKVPGGGLCSTAADLVRFALALQRGELLAAETVARMSTPQATKDGKATRYGLGWTCGKHDGRATIEHGGAQPRVRTFLLSVPDAGAAVALMCNLEGVRLDRLARRICSLVAPAAAPATTGASRQ